MIDNSGRVAIVFGVRNKASIAFAVAKSLKDSGATVACTFQAGNEDKVLPLLEENGFDTNFAKAVDVRSDEEVQSYVDMVAETAGKFDYLLHCVAFGNEKVICAKLPGQDGDKPRYIDMPFKDLVDSFDISAYSLIRICRCAENHLNKGASVLSLTYLASTRVLTTYAGMAISKAALENMTLYLADFFGDRDIRVNTISAGLVMTSSSAGIGGIRHMAKLGKKVAPLGNIKADDVAGAAMYYFSDLSKRVTGNIHFVDGGMNIKAVGAPE